jgi:hypothetical protein
MALTVHTLVAGCTRIHDCPIHLRRVYMTTCWLRVETCVVWPLLQGADSHFLPPTSSLFLASRLLIQTLPCDEIASAFLSWRHHNRGRRDRCFHDLQKRWPEMAIAMQCFIHARHSSSTARSTKRLSYVLLLEIWSFFCIFLRRFTQK